MANTNDDQYLVVVDDERLPEIFKPGGIATVVDEIKLKVGPVVHDVSTKKGRDLIKSTAYKVARTKTYLGKLKDIHTEGLRAQLKQINEEYLKAETDLTEFGKKVRLPLSEWEENEKKRKAKLQSRVDCFLEASRNYPANSAEARDKLKNINQIEIDDSFAEFKAKALTAKLQAETFLKNSIENLEDQERQAEELRKIKEQNAELKRKAEDERKSREAAEQKAEQERQSAIKAEQERRAAVAKAQRENQELEKRIQLDAEQAERDKLAAVEAEKKRLEDEAAEKKRIEEEAEEAARIKREQDEANIAHRKKIDDAIYRSVSELFLADSGGYILVTDEYIAKAIIDGLIPYVKVEYGVIE